MRVGGLILKVVAVVATVHAGGTAGAQPPLPTQLDMDLVRGLVTQSDGRWPPLDTVARDVVESVTGTAFFQGHDPVLVLLSWNFSAMEWSGAPLIRIGSAELRRELQLPADQTVFSYAELSGHRPLHQLVDELRNRPQGKKMNPLEAKVSSIYEKLVELQGAFGGQNLRLIPHPTELGGAWQTIRMAGADASTAPVAAAWAELRDAFLRDEATAFAAAAQQVSSTLAALPAARRPAPALIATELHYNALQPYRVAWIAMVVGVAAALLGLLVRGSPALNGFERAFSVLAFLGLLGGFVVLSYGLWLRWQIAGRIPAANMFESLLFLSWGAGAFGMVALLVLRDRFVPLTASAMGALALILADCLPIDPFVRPIAPVLLDTVWMSIHVPIIMVSYAVLAVAVLIAHGQIVVMAVAPRRRDLAVAIDNLHYWYAVIGSLLLLAGIITGSMWAASSWGRYWGWDPKEVWSLVAFLGYMAILHVRVDHERTPTWVYVIGAVLAVAVFVVVLMPLGPLTGTKLMAFGAAALAALVFIVARGPFATALKSILAFWLIIMTYVGVNYVLGIGLHSYGFGAGAVVRYLFLIGGADLALIALCCALYLLRRPRATPGALPRSQARPA